MRRISVHHKAQFSRRRNYRKRRGNFRVSGESCPTKALPARLRGLKIQIIFGRRAAARPIPRRDKKQPNHFSPNRISYKFKGEKVEKWKSLDEYFRDNSFTFNLFHFF